MKWTFILAAAAMAACSSSATEPDPPPESYICQAIASGEVVDTISCPGYSWYTPGGGSSPSTLVLPMRDPRDGTVFEVDITFPHGPSRGDFSGSELNVSASLGRLPKEWLPPTTGQWWSLHIAYDSSIVDRDGHHDVLHGHGDVTLQPNHYASGPSMVHFTF